MGENVVVCGGGLSGSECAVGLAMAGKKVTVVDVLPEEALCLDAVDLVRVALFALMKDNGIERVQGCGEEPSPATGVVVTLPDGTEAELPADTVVIAFGLRPDASVVEPLLDVVPESYAVGDCRNVGKHLHGQPRRVQRGRGGMRRDSHAARDEQQEAGMITAYVDSLLRDRREALERAKSDGTKVVGYFPGGYVPEELIYASGAIPLCLASGGDARVADEALSLVPSVICPFARAQIGEMLLKTDPFYERTRPAGGPLDLPAREEDRRRLGVPRGSPGVQARRSV